MMYNTLARYYDALVKDDEATKAYVDWIESFHPGTKMLELACGSGEITERLARVGHRLDALDLSADMVEQAKQKDPERLIGFSVRDMLDLTGLPMYEAVVCLCDSFNYLLEKQDVARFFEQVAGHIEAGGLFFFDTHALDRLDEFADEFNETGAFEDGVQYQWSIMAEDDFVYQDFAFYLADGSVVQEHHMQRVYAPRFLEEALEPWFDIVSVTKDFDVEGIAAGEKYFFVCKRKRG